MVHINTHLLLLVSAVLVHSMDSVSYWASKCTPFQKASKNEIICVDCPHQGLALPRGESCYDWLHIKRSLFCRREYFACHQRSDLARSHDGQRFELANNSSDTALGSWNMMFIFSSADRPLQAEYFLVWKKQDCAFNASDYEFGTFSGPRTSFNSECYPTDEGEYVSVVCKFMNGHAFGMAPRSRTSKLIRDCDIPAEVEAFGERKVPV